MDYGIFISGRQKVKLWAIALGKAGDFLPRMTRIGTNFHFVVRAHSRRFSRQSPLLAHGLMMNNEMDWAGKVSNPSVGKVNRLADSGDCV